MLVFVVVEQDYVSKRASPSPSLAPMKSRGALFLYQSTKETFLVLLVD